MLKEKFEEAMAVFSFRQHQDALSYFKLLKENKYTFKDAEEYIVLKIAEATESKPQAEEPLESLALSCPQCQKAMILLAVNFNAATQTGDPTDKTVWLCRSCGEAIFNKESIKEILSKKGGT